ncbi:MAG: NAD-dependent epimerase/dehydratase family protein [Acidimicrobiales bacterium]
MTGTDVARRVLVTGADTFWGGRVIQALEADPQFEVILGLGLHSPSVQFERAEFVRTDQTYSILSRIVTATQVDTIIHTFMVVDSTLVPRRALHEINVIGTLNLLAAAGAVGSPVRHVVVKSSSLVYGSSAEDPNTFSETMPRSHLPRTAVERSLVEAESLVHDFAVDNPSTTVTLLRFANVLGTDIRTSISKNLSRPLCPSLFGYDPLLQFVEEDDVVRALEFVTRECVPGVFNLAGAGRLPWSEVASICGTRLLPLPPLRPGRAIAPLVALGVFEFPPEMEDLLRYGRGLDTTKLCAAGFAYRYTSAGAVQSFIRAVRLRRGAGRSSESYTYEHEVEQFFRHSPSVLRAPDS